MHSHLRHPMIVMVVSLALFSVMDGLMKAASMANGAVSAMFWRNLVCVSVLATVAVVRRAPWPSRKALKIHILRGSVAAVMAVLFFWGLVRVPMAEAMALSFIAPLIALGLAALILREKVRGVAVAGSVVSLVGVVIIAWGRDVSGETSWWGIGAILASAVLYGWNLVIQRQQALAASPLEAVTYQMSVVAILLAGPTMLIGQVPVPSSWPFLLGGGALAVASAMLATYAYARAEAQALAPIEFSAFVWAALTGYLGFGEIPVWTTYAGCVLIIAGCALATKGSTQRTSETELAEAISP